MSEPAYLFYIVASLVLVNSKHVTSAALLMGFAAAIRPTALLPWLAVLFELCKSKSSKGTLARWIGWSGLVAGMTIPLNIHLYGAPFRQLERYSTLPNVGAEAIAAGLDKAGAGHFGPPFRALIETPLRVHVPAWKIVFIYGHLAVVLLACRESLRCRDLKSRTRIWRVCAMWAVLNTAFIVSTGPYWGFHAFDRYCLWAMPAYLVLLQRYLPRRFSVWVMIAICSTGLAVAARWNALTAMRDSPSQITADSTRK
jgi:hypothetical protein